MVFPLAFRDADVDISCWPGMDARQLPAEQQDLYRRREKAMSLYLAKEPLKNIEAATRIASTELPRLLKRCLKAHPDGRLFGFRGLVPHLRIARYQRNKTVEGAGSSGRAGAFAQLLELYPSLDKLICQELRARRVVVLGDPPQRRVMGLKPLHAKFLKACREEGYF